MTTLKPMSFPSAGGLRGAIGKNFGILYELEVGETMRAGYVSIGGTLATQPAVSHLVTSPSQVNTHTYTLPETIPLKGGVMRTDGDGVMTWAPPSRTFLNRVEIPDVHEHILTGTTISGRATFYLTTNGQSTGTALFSTILALIPSVTRAYTVVESTPSVAIDSVSADRKLVVVNCAYASDASKMHTHLVIPNGTSVTLLAKGVPVP